jgi:hypothetical protein
MVVRLAAPASLLACLGGFLIACTPPSAPPPTTTTTTPATTTTTPATITTTPATITTLPPVARAATTTAAPPPIPPIGTCPTWELLAQPPVATSNIVEASGLAGGRANPGVWWTHNDSGDMPRVFALEGDGRLLTTVEVTGAQAWDWEDIDIAPGPGGRPYLWAADLGDNLKVRQGSIGYQLYRFPEPGLGALAPAKLTATAERINVVYPDAAHNVEATLVDPISGDYIIFTKERPSKIFRIPAASLVNGATVVPQKLGQLELSDPNTTNDRPVGADISADGKMIVIKLMELTFFWRRDPGETVAQAVARPPCAGVDLGSGEAIAFNASGGQLATLAEGSGQPLLRYARR